MMNVAGWLPVAASVHLWAAVVFEHRQKNLAAIHH